MNIEIADRLVKLRKKHNLSQEELANKLGISRQAVSKWERAEASPDTDNLITLAKLYNVSLDDLLYSEDSEVVYKDNDANEDLNYEDENVRIVYGNGKKIIITNDNDDEVNVKTRWEMFPYPLVTVIAFFLIGWYWGYWESSWLVFLTIPLYYTLGTAIRKRDAAVFAYPVLATIAFFVIGFTWGLWLYSWLVFLTIPMYYAIVEIIKRK